MSPASSSWIVLPLIIIITIGAIIWKRMKRSYVKVGRVSKILFYPVKSLKGIELSEGVCTESGLQVQGLFERSFMLMTKDKCLLSQCEFPKLSLLTPKIVDSKLIIYGPDVDPLVLIIDVIPNANQEIIEYRMEYRMVGEITCVYDCGEIASEWFEKYLDASGIRLVRFFPDSPLNNFPQLHSFFSKPNKKKKSKDLQDLAPIHVMSQSSIDDLNFRLVDRHVTHTNFRPNILIDECPPYAEDFWQYIKFGNQVEMENVVPVARCLMTTMEPDKGILTQKEPMVTLRKYRIPSDPKILQITGSIPCFGRACFLLRPGTVKVHDYIFAVLFDAH